MYPYSNSLVRVCGLYVGSAKTYMRDYSPALFLNMETDTTYKLRLVPPTAIYDLSDKRMAIARTILDKVLSKEFYSFYGFLVEKGQCIKIHFPTEEEAKYAYNNDLEIILQAFTLAYAEYRGKKKVCSGYQIGLFDESALSDNEIHLVIREKLISGTVAFLDKQWRKADAKHIAEGGHPEQTEPKKSAKQLREEKEMEEREAAEDAEDYERFKRWLNQTITILRLFHGEQGTRISDKVIELNNSNPELQYFFRVHHQVVREMTRNEILSPKVSVVKEDDISHGIGAK